MGNPKRIYHILIFISIGLLILIGRLAQIQLFDTLSFSRHQINLVEESVEQRVHSIAIDDGRGKLLDRYGELIQEVHKPAVILFPFLVRENTQLRKISNVLKVSAEQLERKLEDRSTPFVFKSNDISIAIVEEINEMQIPGAYGQMIVQDRQTDFAAHFIGAVRENPKLVLERYPDRVEKGLLNKTTEIGIRGIQKAFDPFLVSEGESKLIYHVEQSGRPLFGLDVKYKAPSNPFYPIALNTTLDQEKQKILEQAISDAQIQKGGAILLDVQTSDVLAMVSRPLFPGSNPLKEGTENQMLIPQTPGSVFKIVTAAAAIEQNLQLADRRFNCDQNVYQDDVATRKLGSLSFEESFYQSCNATFAELLNELVQKDETVLENLGEKLGITQYSGWNGSVFHLDPFQHFPGEKKNIFWGSNEEKRVPRAVSQTAIGQLNVRLSPISVANMMAMIARGGEKKQARAALSVDYKNGATLVEFEEQDIKGPELSRYTMNRLQSLLQGVVEHPKGTGHASFANLPWAVAGKSGTAEKGDTAENNKWFAGYFPADHPKYALVVVDLQAKSHQSKTNRSFAQIVQKLYEYDQQSLSND
ncbi:penicillin-binding protein 2 [Alkalihalobacillus sp. AL-G]|uniref:peptidoglycan D,D-transpeptidase FtsI family protein n=1 Tax=Alkalihalobacillus sp. AL-G TaxID=2926399 RepID=UPI002729D133|nr:penicillin-binding transpeptidase domain-containing protein [Alkalihalobacillus sp. AL-G]WLD92184.1 penicillin-binding protein 2 [Alkalihalobacillus sp. AL-G]